MLAAAQGFFYEVLSRLAGVVVGYLLAAWEYPRVSSWLSPYTKAEWVADAAGFLIIFLAVVLLAGIAGHITRWAVKEVGLRWFDGVLGAVFGFVRADLAGFCDLSVGCHVCSQSTYSGVRIWRRTF